MAGQIFIRTEGGETIKLSLVEVALFDAKVIEQDFKAKQDTAQPILEYFQPLQKQAEEAKDQADKAKDLAGKATKAEEEAEEANEEASLGISGSEKKDASPEVQAAIDAVGEEDKENSPISKVANMAGSSLTDDLPLLSKSLKEIEDQAADAIKKGQDSGTADSIKAANDAIKLAVESISNAADKIAEKASDLCRNINGMADYPLSVLYYFSALPEPLQVTKTDAEGQFNFQVPSGSYVLVAFSSRKAGVDEVGEPLTEWYHWIVKINVDSDKTVMLANDNLSSSGSPDSLVFAQEDGNAAENQDYISIAMQGKDIRTLAAIVSAQRERERQATLEGFRKDPKLAQQKAIEAYPALGIAGSELNKEFIARMKRYQLEKKEFFVDPDWPIRLAKECSDDLAAKSPPK